MSPVLHRTGLALALGFAFAAAPLLPASASPRHPLSCKPLPPAEVELRLVSQAAGQPAAIEAQIRAYRPLEDVRLELDLPQGAAVPPGRDRSFGRITSGSHRALSFRAAIPAAGRSEVYARITFRMPGGEVMTSAAHLSFVDGRPAPPPAYRTSHWDGNEVLEVPAGGVR